MLVKFNVVSEASGSMNGITASRNRGGPYFRNRTVPSNPNTTAQQLVRQKLSELVAAFLQELDDAQRQSWADYAAANPITNPLGDQRNAGAVGMYIRLNTVRLMMALDRVDTPPITNGPTLLTPFTISGVTTGSTADIAFDNTDEWAGLGGGLALFASRSIPLSITSFSGPFRFSEAVLGAATPPTSPANITLPFFIPDNTKLYVRGIASAPDGRLSNEVIDFLIVT